MDRAPRIAHIGLAVADLESALRFYRDVLEVETATSGTADGADMVSVRLGNADVELMTSASTDTPVGRFLAKRGPGIHHLCLRVPDLDRALERCRELGYRLIDAAPRPGAHGRRVAFVHPKSTDGVLLELTE